MRSFGVDDVIDLQRRKTGQLFEFSCEAGPILGQADAETRARLKAYAEDMGVVFQITDDLLDVTSTAEKTGKAVGKDADMGKQTLVTLLGLEGARAEAEKRARRAVEALGPYAATVAGIVGLAVFSAGSGRVTSRVLLNRSLTAEGQSQSKKCRLLRSFFAFMRYPRGQRSFL